MYLKIFGAALIICGCAGVGIMIAGGNRSALDSLKQLQISLDFIQCELQYHLTPLPQLCTQASDHTSGTVKQFWKILARELEDQICPDVSGCVSSALAAVILPQQTAQILRQLGASLGRFDLNGQVTALESARQACRMQIARLSEDFPQRQRSCQTLALCAGAALAILLL